MCLLNSRIVTSIPRGDGVARDRAMLPEAAVVQGPVCYSFDSDPLLRTVKMTELIFIQ